MIYVFYANGFEEIEGVAPVDMLRRCDLEVTTVGVGGRTVVGAHGICIQTDISEDEMCFDNIEAVVLPGGMPGTLNLERSDVVRKAVDVAYNNGKCIAAICAAPSILGHMGLLEGKEAVCFPGFEQELNGAVISDKKVVSSGQFITAAGVGVAVKFGIEIARRFCGKNKAERVLASIQCEK